MDCEFLIIGGGIAGVSAAARLAPLGRVILCEGEDHLAHHASGRSAALYEPSYGRAPVKALSEASGDYLRAAHGGVLSPRGLMIAARAEEAAQFAADVAEMNLTEIAPAAACARVPVLDPGQVALAAAADHAWDIDTDRLIRNFAREARDHGASIITRAPVTAIERLDNGWRVETGAGVFRAARLVDAAGPWADRIAEMAGIAPRGIRPFRRSMARIPAPAGHDVSAWPMLFGPGESWYAKPDAGALIVSPADEDPAEPHDAFTDDMVLAEGLARYEAMVTAPVTRMLANWAGLRSFAPDRVLVIGPDPADRDFLWLAGQGGYGFQTAPAASQLLADLAAGRAPALDDAIVAALTPGRFETGGAGARA